MMNTSREILVQATESEIHKLRQQVMHLEGEIKILEQSLEIITREDAARVDRLISPNGSGASPTDRTLILLSEDPTKWWTVPLLRDRLREEVDQGIVDSKAKDLLAVCHSIRRRLEDQGKIEIRVRGKKTQFRKAYK